MVFLLSLKVHRARKETIVAACDAEILGGKFQDGEKRIEVYRSFYGDIMIEEAELGTYLQGATIINLVGERAVGAAIQLGYVDPERVLKIGATVHAQAATIQKQ